MLVQLVYILCKKTYRPVQIFGWLKLHALVKELELIQENLTGQIQLYMAGLWCDDEKSLISVFQDLFIWENVYIFKSDFYILVYVATSQIYVANQIAVIG